MSFFLTMLCSSSLVGRDYISQPFLQEGSVKQQEALISLYGRIHQMGQRSCDNVRTVEACKCTYITFYFYMFLSLIPTSGTRLVKLWRALCSFHSLSKCSCFTKQIENCEVCEVSLPAF